MSKATKLSGPEQVADFMLTVKHPLNTAMVALREIILSANNGITEHIKWNGPSFCFGGDDRKRLTYTGTTVSWSFFTAAQKVKK